jgi:hypothetical protein
MDSPRPLRPLVRDSGTIEVNTASGTVYTLPLQQRWQLREAEREAAQQTPKAPSPRVPAALPRRPVARTGGGSTPSLHVLVPQRSSETSASIVSAGYTTPESEVYMTPAGDAPSAAPVRRRRERAPARGGMCGCGSRPKDTIEEPPESGEELPAVEPAPPPAVEAAAEVEASPVPEEVAEESGPDLALKRWYWHRDHAAERAKRMELNEGGGLKSSKDTPGQPGAAELPTQALEDPYIDSYIAAQQLHNGLNDVVMICTRTMNHNTVIYRARRKGDTGGSINSSSKSRDPSQLSPAAAASVFDTDDPMDYYWYDNAPDFVTKRRATGVLTDRIEMNGFEKKGFGLNIDDKRAAAEGVVVVKMVAMPDSVFAGVPDVDGRYGVLKPGEFRLEHGEDGVARFVTVISNQQCYAEKIYISTQNQRFNPIPKVMFVRLFGRNVDTGESVTQDVKA